MANLLLPLRDPVSLSRCLAPRHMHGSSHNAFLFRHEGENEAGMAKACCDGTVAARCSNTASKIR